MARVGLSLLARLAARLGLVRCGLVCLAARLGKAGLIGLDWIGLDWIGLSLGLERLGRAWLGLACHHGSARPGVDWFVSGNGWGRVGLDRNGLVRYVLLDRLELSQRELAVALASAGA